VANPINRYLLNQQTPDLRYGDDGSLTIRVDASKNVL
jgi:hypothetical protein